MASPAEKSPCSTRQKLGDDNTIAGAIAATTRSLHSRLNKSILSRLPQALPPRASDPSAYVTGLLHIAPIYIKFEGIWHDFLHAQTRDDMEAHAKPAAVPAAAVPTLVNFPPPSSFPPQTHGPALPARAHSILHALHLPELIRGHKLKSDIQHLTGWPDHVVDSQLKVASQSPHLAAMLRHMEASLAEKPLLLVTYMYIMYMALFAGGRFIRASLESSGRDFWQTPLTPIKPTMQPCVLPAPWALDSDEAEPKLHNKFHKCNPLPLSFFHFDTPNDGEDLKIEFKRRLRTCEADLEPQEADSIIQEATSIFEYITSIVHQLDTVCEDDSSDNDSATTFGDCLQVLPILGRLRDSMAVAKERRAKTSSTTLSSEDDSADTVIHRHGDCSSSSSESRTSGSAAVPEYPPLPTITRVELYPLAAAAGSTTARFKPALGPQKSEKKAWIGKREQMRTADVTSCILAALLGIVAIGVVMATRRNMAT